MGDSDDRASMGTSRARLMRSVVHVIRPALVAKSAVALLGQSRVAERVAHYLRKRRGAVDAGELAAKPEGRLQLQLPRRSGLGFRHPPES